MVTRSTTECTSARTSSNACGMPNRSAAARAFSRRPLATATRSTRGCARNTGIWTLLPNPVPITPTRSRGAIRSVRLGMGVPQRLAGRLPPRRQDRGSHPYRDHPRQVCFQQVEPEEREDSRLHGARQRVDDPREDQSHRAEPVDHEDARAHRRVDIGEEALPLATLSGDVRGPAHDERRERIGPQVASRRPIRTAVPPWRRAKTGRPAPPSRMYTTWLRNARRAPRIAPAARTANTCNVNGTLVTNG